MLFELQIGLVLLTLGISATPVPESRTGASFLVPISRRSFRQKSPSHTKLITIFNSAIAVTVLIRLFYNLNLNVRLISRKRSYAGC